jgi:Family of unknown function (DUF6152)
MRTETNRVVRIGLLFGALFLVSQPLLAHHSFTAEFDKDKPIRLTGTITQVDWINPHCYMEMDVNKPDGSSEHWRFEFGAPVGLRKAGMRQDMLQIGQQMTITGYAAKDGKPLGWVAKLIFPDGKIIQITGDATDAPK